MSVLNGTQLDLDQQKHDQMSETEETDTEMKPESPGMASQSTSPVAKTSPCSSGKSASSEPGGPCNKGSVSSPQAISTATQSPTAELASTSKIPHRGKSPLASRSKVHPAMCPHRPEHVKEGVLNGSTRGEASKHTQSRDILKSAGKMKHPLGKTNIEEITESERPSGAETPDDFVRERDDEHTRRGQWRPNPKFAFRKWEDDPEPPTSQLRPTKSAWGESLRGDGCSLASPAEQSRRPHIAIPSLLPERANRGLPRWRPHDPNWERHRQAAFAGQVPSPRIPFHLRPSFPANREENANTYGNIKYLVHRQKCKAAQGEANDAKGGATNAEGEATAAQEEGTATQGGVNDAQGATVAQGVTDTRRSSATTSSQGVKVKGAVSGVNSCKEIVCRQKQRLLAEFSNEDEEEEEDQCRICYSGGSSPANQMLSPCRCSGSLRFVHLKCLKRWLQVKIQKGVRYLGVITCEICTGFLTLDPELLDVKEYCKKHHKDKMAFLRARGTRIRVQPVIPHETSNP